MDRLRVLLLAEAANPEMVSVPLVGWSHAAALLERVDGHLVTQVRNDDAIRRAGLAADRFTVVDSERVAAPAYKLATRLRGGGDRGWTTLTAITVLSHWYFERLAWRRFGADIRARKWDVVHRLTPISPAIPSWIASKCRRAGVPFVLGPVNGGVPWPPEFRSERKRENEWMSRLRAAHKLVPGYRATRRDAAAILTGSLTTLAEIPRKSRDRCVYLPENAVDPGRFARARTGPATLPLRVAFVGRLVPLKCADVLIEAAAPFVREGRMIVDFIGDGPEMPRLRADAQRLGVAGGTLFDGWVDHRSLPDRLAQSSIFAFPSIREFGGGAVLEAMALGLLPIVVNYGGPGELIDDATGVRVPMAARERLIEGFRAALGEFVARPETIAPIGVRARQRVMDLFTWPAKAQQTMEIYRWVLGRRPDRPEFGFVDPRRIRSILTEG